MNEPTLIANALEAEAQQEAEHGMEAGPGKRRIDAQCRKHVPPALAEYAFEKMVECDAIGEVIAEDLARDRVPTAAEASAAPKQDPVSPQYRRQPLGMDEQVRSRLTLIAREAAISSSHRYNYMPAIPEAALEWQPHEWVLQAMRMVELQNTHADQSEVERLRAELDRYQDMLQSTSLECGERLERMEAQLAERDALLRDAVDDLEDWRRSFPDANSSVADGIIERADALLSASAEPAKKIESIYGHHPSCKAVSDYSPGDCTCGAEPADGVAVPEGLYAVHYLDNWDGQGDRCHLIARKDEQGRWFHEESGKQLLDFEGDKILQVWPLAAAPQPPQQGELAAIRGTIRTDSSAVIAGLQADVARLREALQFAVDTVAADGLDDWYVKAEAALAGAGGE